MSISSPVAANGAMMTTPTIECRVCNEAYTINGSHVPRLLACCGHTVCDSCVHSLLAAQRQLAQANFTQNEHHQIQQQLWNMHPHPPHLQLPAVIPTSNVGLVIHQVHQQQQPQPHVDAGMQMFNYYYDAGPQPSLPGASHPLAYTVDCPFDRVPSPLVAEMPVNADGPPVYTLRKNYALIEVIERMQQSAQSSSEGSVVVQMDAINTSLGQSSLQPSSGNELIRSTAQTTPSLDPLQHVLNNAQVSPIVSSVFAQQRAMGVACDEDGNHFAVLFCCVCETHLCVDCARRSHASRTLQRHRSTTLSQKPHAPHKCSYHSAYAVEFVCQEANCTPSAGLMCLLCRDYGRHANHAHVLLENHAARERSTLVVARRDVEEWQRDVGRLYNDVRRAFHDLIGDPSAIPTFHNASHIPRHSSVMSHPAGSAHEAHAIIEAHFAELSRTLETQYSEALQTLDVHVHGRCQQLQDMIGDVTRAMQHLHTLVGQLSAISDQPDVALIERSTELRAQIETTKTMYTTLIQQLPARLDSIDTRTPVMMTRGDNRLHIGALVEVRVVMVGLDGAGKTSLLAKMRQVETSTTIPTIGFNVETVDYKSLKFTFWDVGGMPKLRPLWKHYYANTQAIIFVVDVADRERFPEVQSELVKILSEHELQDAAILILANKTDLLESSSTRHDSLADALTLHKLCYGRAWHVHECSAKTGDRLDYALDWLSTQLLSTTTLPPQSTQSTSPSMRAATSPPPPRSSTEIV